MDVRVKQCGTGHLLDDWAFDQFLNYFLTCSGDGDALAHNPDKAVRPQSRQPPEFARSKER
jgi:hypothetical protein